jgi:hypothetical protein
MRLDATGHVEWLCHKGLTVESLLTGYALPELLHGARLDFIFMQLGGNDFRRGVSADDLAVQMLALKLRSIFLVYGVQRTICGHSWTTADCNGTTV